MIGKIDRPMHLQTATTNYTGRRAGRAFAEQYAGLGGVVLAVSGFSGFEHAYRFDSTTTYVISLDGEVQGSCWPKEMCHHLPAPGKYTLSVTMMIPGEPASEFVFDGPVEIRRNDTLFVLVEMRLDDASAKPVFRAGYVSEVAALRGKLPVVTPAAVLTPAVTPERSEFRDSNTLLHDGPFGYDDARTADLINEPPHRYAFDRAGAAMTFRSRPFMLRWIPAITVASMCAAISMIWPSFVYGEEPAPAFVWSLLLLPWLVPLAMLVTANRWSFAHFEGMLLTVRHHFRTEPAIDLRQVVSVTGASGGNGTVLTFSGDDLMQVQFRCNGYDGRTMHAIAVRLAATATLDDVARDMLRHRTDWRTRSTREQRPPGSERSSSKRSSKYTWMGLIVGLVLAGALHFVTNRISDTVPDSTAPTETGVASPTTINQPDTAQTGATNGLITTRRLPLDSSSGSVAVLAADMVDGAAFIAARLAVPDGAPLPAAGLPAVAVGAQPMGAGLNGGTVAQWSYAWSDPDTAAAEQLASELANAGWQETVESGEVIVNILGDGPLQAARQWKFEDPTESNDNQVTVLAFVLDDGPTVIEVSVEAEIPSEFSNTFAPVFQFADALPLPETSDTVVVRDTYVSYGSAEGGPLPTAAHFGYVTFLLPGSQDLAEVTDFYASGMNGRAGFGLVPDAAAEGASFTYQADDGRVTRVIPAWLDDQVSITFVVDLR